MTLSNEEMVARLLLAALLAGIIGLERESRHRAAGLRTHLLVSVGSALVMLISVYGFPGFPLDRRDPARLAAQVVSGIGFLGAGTILREGVSIRGLTTAASLWVVSGIGLAAGAGFYAGALVTTVLTGLALLYLSRLERFVNPVRAERYLIKVAGRARELGSLEDRLKRLGIRVRQVDLEYCTNEEASLISLGIYVPDQVSPAAVVAALAESPETLEVHLDE
ncbi:MAG: MgtC/SapB family protein [Chitinophagales bacterium]